MTAVTVVNLRLFYDVNDLPLAAQTHA